MEGLCVLWMCGWRRTSAALETILAFLDNLKISTRLALAFGYVVALAAAIVLVGVSRLGEVDRSYQAVGKLSRVERDA